MNNVTTAHCCGGVSLKACVHARQVLQRILPEESWATLKNSASSRAAELRDEAL